MGAHRRAPDHRVRGPVPVRLHGAHELVRDADRVVRVLEPDAPVRLTREGRVVALLDERPGLLLLELLAVDEVEDVRVADVEDDHLRRTPGFSTRLDNARKCVVAAHEGDRAAGRPAAGHLLPR